MLELLIYDMSSLQTACFFQIFNPGELDFYAKEMDLDQTAEFWCFVFPTKTEPPQHGDRSRPGDEHGLR